MKRKLLMFLLVILVAFLVIFKFMAGNLALYGIQEFNKNASVNLQTDDIKFSYLTNFSFKPFKIFDKDNPFLHVEFDKFSTYISLVDLLKLALEIKSEGDIYDGTSKINFWKNFRSDNIRGEIFLENVNLSKHQFLQGIPFNGIIKGGYLNLKNYDLKLDKNKNDYYVSYVGGDFSLNDLKITKQLTIPSAISGLIFDITIPKINFSQISSVYKFKNDTVYLNDFSLKSDDLAVSSYNCEFNTKKNLFSNCEIKFSFTDKGLKDFSTWLVFLGDVKFEANKEYHIELHGLNYRFINDINE